MYSEGVSQKELRAASSAAAILHCGERCRLLRRAEGRVGRWAVPPSQRQLRIASETLLQADWVLRKGDDERW